MNKTAYWAGSGTVDDPYLIKDANDLYAVGYTTCEWDKHFKVTTDINLSNYPLYLNRIGTIPNPFTGTFDGNNHIITAYAYRLYVNGYQYEYDYYPTGFFGAVTGPNAAVTNLHLVNVNIAPSSVYMDHCSGGLVGWLGDGTISNCTVTGGSVKSAGYGGGLIGYSENANIINCHASPSVSGGSDYSGGLVGYSDGNIQDCSAAGYVYSGIAASNGGLVGSNYGKIIRCYSTGNVGNGYYGCGGLAGYNGGIIEQCFAAGNVQAKAYIGGLLGRNSGTVANCYSLGKVNSENVIVNGTTSTGGLIGYNSSNVKNCYAACTFSSSSNYIGGLVGGNSGNVSASFWDVNTSGRPTSGGGTGKTTGEMKTLSTFINVGWDFVGEILNGPNDFWTIREGISYPKLAWQDPIAADINLSSNWMYQNLPGQTKSSITAQFGNINDPCGNSSYKYYWSFELPDDVSVEPITVAGGDVNDSFWTFAAPGCNETNSVSNSGKTFKVIVKIVGNDFGNSGIVEKEFAIALLGDTNNDGVVNIADRSIANTFWQTGSAGPYKLKDCNLNCDGVVNIADRSIANSIWRGVLGSNSVANPCPLR
jgi:hypothetical protein